MGRLFIIATPIGNLGDITLRSIETLKNVDLILAEDTRTSGNLLKHFQIETPCQSFHLHNEHKVLNSILEKLQSGMQIALISDAGTPGISDPGFLLIRACVENNIEMEALPGANAFIPALLLSGFPCDKFCFEGFLPHKKGRQKILSELKSEKRTMIFYESPHRLLKTLEQFSDAFGENRLVSVSREITKKFEETIRGTFSDVIHHFKSNEPKGEFVIVIQGLQKEKKIKTNKYRSQSEEE